MFCLANCVLLTLRINSSDLPENILPQITSTQPVCFIISIRWPLLSYLSSPDFYKEIIYFYTNQLNTDLVDRKSTRPELQSRENLVCRLLLEKKKTATSNA